jgi:hypothetical protein
MTRRPETRTVETPARSSQHHVGAICQTGLLLALSTGLGFGFGAVIDRLTSQDPAAGASVLVWTDRSRDGWLELSGRTESIGEVALAAQREIGPAVANADATCHGHLGSGGPTQDTPEMTAPPAWCGQ